MTFGTLSLVIVGLAGAAVAAGVLQTVVAARLRDRLDGLFALGLFSLAASLAATVGYNTAADADTYRHFYQWHALLSRGFFLTWPFFVARLAGFRSPWVVRGWFGVELVKAVLLLACLDTPYFFDVRGVVRHPTAWGELVSAPTGRGTWLQPIQLLVPLVGFGVTTAGTVRLLKERRRRDAALLGLIAVTAAVVVVYDNLVDVLGLPDFQAAELGLLVPVVAMGWTTAGRLVDAAQARSELVERDARLAAMLTALDEGVVGTDPEGRITWLNPRAALLGHPDAGGGDRTPFEEAFAMDPLPLPGGAAPVYQLRATGRRVEVARSPLAALDGRTLGQVVVLRDVTQRLELEGQLRRTQQMQAIGELSAGIAHDFNNILGGIVLSADSLASDAAGEPPVEISAIKTACQRGADLIQKLLAFGRRTHRELRVVAVHELLQSAAAILRRGVGPRVRLELRLEAAEDAVRGDAGALESAFLNLGINARDAMPRGGALEIRTRIERGPYWRWLRIDFADQGEGIAPENLERIFDPYFTTKSQSGGTGLGLPMVLGTLQSHGGMVSVESRLGGGTCFTLRLPLTDPPGLGPTPGAHPPLPPTRVLLVDDDPTILSTVSRLLGKEGHQVTAAVSRRLALERAREGRPDLAILDLQLADGSGLDLLGSLREMHPGLPVLIVSGYLPESVLSQALSLERVLLVQKPVETGRLLQAMGRLTASRAS